MRWNVGSGVRQCEVDCVARIKIKEEQINMASEGNLPAVVKAGTLDKARGIFGIPPDTNMQGFGLDNSGLTINFRACTIENLAKDRSGAIREDSTATGILVVNQKALLRGPTLMPLRYNFLISLHPDIHVAATASHVGFASHTSLSHSLSTVILAHKQLNLADLPYIWKILAVD